VTTIVNQEIRILREVVSKYLDPSTHLAFVFGSRALGNAKKFSDYDIGIAGARLDPELYFTLMEEFENSSFPYLVDIVQFADLTSSFCAIALEKIVPLNFEGGEDEVRRATEKFRTSA